MPNPRAWIWTEDRQWAASRLHKNWDGGFLSKKRVLSWELEVRTENSGAGSQHMGAVVLKGAFDGELTISLRDEAV